MTGGSPREIRDIVAEAMRVERLGFVRPLWRDWDAFAPDETERVRLRADHLIRLLAGEGLAIVRAGDPAPAPAPTSAVVWRYYLAGQKVERLVRRDGDGWQIITVSDGKETVEQTFTLAAAHVNAGLVLTDDPAARTIAGLGRQLAALTEIYRICAQATGGPA